MTVRTNWYTDDAPAQADMNSDFILNNPLLWAPETPVLYHAVFTLRHGKSILDKHIIRFGVRTAVFDEEDGFVLSGVKTKLWGVNLHQDGGAAGAAVPMRSGGGVLRNL